MFLSTVESGIDARGRVLVPASFRSALGGAGKFFLFPSVDQGGYLEGGGDELMASYKSILMQMQPHDPARRAFMHAIFAKGSEVTMDQAGRATLPKPLMEAAGISDMVVFVGAFDRFQIWSPDRFAAFDEEMSKQAADSQDALAAPFADSQRFKTPGGQA